MSYKIIEIAKLTPHIGAEISGVDLTKPIDQATYTEIRRALVENLVIFFRDQAITVDQHKTFANLFGELFSHPASTPIAGYPEVIPIKADENSKKVAGEVWHTDTSCNAVPPMGSILHMHVVPEVGGDTLFASMYAAYEALSQTMKTALEGMTAHHSGTKAYQGYLDNNKVYPNADHPVVCVHPESGRKLLFVNRFYTTRINELPQQESDDLLQFLLRHVETPEFQCRFRWRKNSIAFWDNRCAQHRAIFDYWPNRRSGYRIQVQSQAAMSAASPRRAAA
jgi:taurine dioxygenase